jgi:ABC-type lipoprotein export system ATPase subunit
MASLEPSGPAQPPSAERPAGDSLDILGAQARAVREEAGEADGLVVCDRLVRIYTAEGIEVQALQGLDLVVAEGELTALVGVSGSGKSTLLRILGGLDRPTAGTVVVAGRNLAELVGRDWLEYRRRTVGFVWQQASQNLVPYLTAQQNVTTPMRLAGTRRRTRNDRAMQLLEAVGAADCRDRRPDQMSGGQQQRVAIATACANNPKLLLADEPTGELDSATAAEVFGALRTVNSDFGTTVLIVTHDADVSQQVARTVAIRNGRTSTETLRAAPGGGGRDEAGVEYAVLDRSGRLQLPERMTTRLGMRDLVRLDEQPDHIAVHPSDETRPSEA